MTIDSKATAARLEAATRLAYDRTRLACERTLLAWVRTATTLITFGFTVFSFSLLAGTMQNTLGLRRIRAQWPDAPNSIAAWLAGVMGLLGLIVLITTLVRR